MNLRRWVRKLAAGGAVAALLAAAGDAAGQGFGPPGGGGGDRGDRGSRGGGMFSSDSSFDRYIQSYGGSGDTLDYSRVSPQVRQQADMMSQRFGGPPLPTSGVISRAQYKVDFDKRMESVRSQFGGGRGMGGPPGMTPPTMSAPPGGAPGTATMTFGGPPGGSPGMMSMDRGGRDRGGDRGGGGGMMTDEWFQSRFTGYDRDKNGRITPDEASGSLQGNFAQADTNRDGAVDFNEYKVYAQARMSGMSGGPPGMTPPGMTPPVGDPNQQQQWGGQQWGGDRGDRGGDRGQQQQQDDPRPVVYRYGKLPKDLPSWFNSLDEDKDGQIGLYEWRRGERTAAEFVKYDLNDDGFITAEEYLRYRVEKDEAEKKEAGTGDGPRPSGATRGGGDDRSSRGGQPSRGGPSKDERKDEKRSSGGSGGNPFRGG